MAHNILSSPLLPTQESNDLQETVRRPIFQSMSLCLALAAAVFSMFSLRLPTACVSYSEEETRKPMECEALKDSPTAVHLLPFCYMNCNDASLFIYSCALVCGMLLQTIVVSPACCGCGSFLHVTVSFNYSGWMEWLGNPPRVLRWFCQSLVEKLGKWQQMHSSRLPLPMRRIQRTAVRLYSLALLELIMHGLSNLHLSHHGVSFSCPGQSGKIAKLFAEVEYRGAQVFGKVMICGLLALSIFLGQLAKWRVSFICEVRALKKAMTQGDHESVICREKEHLKLSQVNGKVLVRAELVEPQDGEHPFLDEENLKWRHDLFESEGWTLDRSVKVYFAKPKDSEEKLFRKRLLAVLGFGIVFLYSASTSCWGCINKIKLGEPKSDSMLEIQAKMLLLGSCGRHTGSGASCLLGACCLAVVAFAQAVIIKAKQKALPPGAQMRFAYMSKATKKKMKNETPQTPVENAEDTSPSSPTTITSHIWLSKASGAWEPADFRVQDDRGKWRRSQALYNVYLPADPNAEGLPSADGLPTDQEGHSDMQIYGYFQREDDRKKKINKINQVVPLHFLDDVAYVSLNVGSQRAWDKFAILASLVALGLTVLDLINHWLYLEGDELQSCADIFDGNCLMLDNRVSDIPSTSAIGVVYATCGAILTAVIIVMLAKETRTS